MTTTQTTQNPSPIQGPNTNATASPDDAKAKEVQAQKLIDEQKAAEAAKAKENAEALAAAEEQAKREEAAAAESKKRTVYSPTSMPDGAPTPGKVVKGTDMVRPCVEGCDVLVDSLTLVQYRAGVWTEAKPSAWLDGQLRAKKIELR